MFLSVYSKVESFVAAFTRRRFWKVYLALLCSFYCIASNLPPYTIFTHSHSTGAKVWQRINRQIDHPFTNDTLPGPESHEAHITFRLTAPLIGKLLATHNVEQRMLDLFIIQNLFGFLFFYFLIVFAENNFGNRLASVLLPWCFVSLYAGKTFFNDTYFFFDGMAYFFLLLTVCTRKPWIVFAGLLLAFFTDERSVIGSGFVLLYHMVKDNGKKPDKLIIGTIISAVGIYVALRVLLLQSYFGLTIPHGDIAFSHIVQHTRFRFIVLGIFTAFKSFWLVLAIGIFYLKGFWSKAIFAGTLLAIVLAGISVFDFSRSISYGFVGLLVVLACLYQQHTKPFFLNATLFLLFATSIINPLYDVHGKVLLINRSLLEQYFDAKLTEY